MNPVRRLLPVLAVLLALALPASASAATATPFEGDGMWLWQVRASERGDLARIAARARAAGMEFVVVKAAHGTQAWSQFSPELVGALHAEGVRACAYQRALARSPAREARVLAGAVAVGADCLVIDAESEYEGRYGAATSYVRALRAAIGPDFPVGLTSFPYVDYHRRFPYSVFLGDGGAQVNLPQMYWRLIGTSVEGIFARTWAQHAVYGRPIHPIGQVFGRPRGTEIRRFRSLAAARGASGVSWWVWQHATGAQWRALSLPLSPVRRYSARPGYAALRPGMSGDPVRWLQLRLRAAGRREVRTTSRFDAVTAAAVVAFRVTRGLSPVAVVDDTTWSALLDAAPPGARVPGTSVTPPSAVQPPGAPAPGGTAPAPGGAAPA